MKSVAVPERSAEVPIPLNGYGQRDPQGDYVTELLGRVDRIHRSSLVPSDYLQVSREITDLVQSEVEEIRATTGIDASEKYIRLLTNRRTEQFHYGGTNVASVYDAHGVVVVAIGPEQISAFLRTIPAEQRQDIVIRYVEPWPTEPSPLSA